MQKKLITLISLTAALTLSACNSGGALTQNPSSSNALNNTNLPVVIGENNQRLFNVNYNEDANGKNLTGASNNKFISLRPLTKEEAIQADKIGQEQGNSLNTTSLNATSNSVFSVADPILDTPEFFNGHQEVLDQGSFGSCVTFATNAALSYVSTGVTTNIAPLDTLLQGFLNNQNDMTKTGWDGLNGTGQILMRILDNREGYYRSYTQTKDLYNNLSHNYSKINTGGDLTLSKLYNVDGFKDNIEIYDSIVKAHYPQKQINNIVYNNLNIKQGSNNNAIKLKQSLDSGHKVVVGFVIYDSLQKPKCKNGNVNGDAYFKYDNSKTLVTNASLVSTKKDAWTKASGCALGGHEVIVASYFENEAGQLIFLIRNSWSDQAGDQGNYYMTADYFNRAGMDGYELQSV